MDAKLIGKDLLACIDLEKASDIVIDAVVAEINKIAADSSNKFDDAAAGLLLPILVPQLKELAKKKIAEI
jgi:Na+/phosphate symporter